MENTRDFYNKTGGTKARFCAKRVMTHGKENRDPTEAQEISKRLREYTEPYHQDPNVHGKYEAVLINEFEPDILTSQVEWALEIIN